MEAEHYKTPKNLSDFVYDENSDDSKIAQMFSFFDGDEYGKFYWVENKLSNRPDLHAFLLLDKLVPSVPIEGPTKYIPVLYSDIVSDAEQDEIYLGVKIKELEKVITIEHVLELSRCGVMYNSEYDCLYMFA